MCRGIYNSGLEKYRVVTLDNVSWYIQGAARYGHGWRVHLGDDVPLIRLDVITEDLVSFLVLVVCEPSDQVDLCCHHAAVDAADLR